MEAANAKSAKYETGKEIGEVVIQLAQESEHLAMKERQNYSPVLKKWNTIAAAVAALTLNNCYGHVLKQYLSEINTPMVVEVILVLQRAKILEDFLVQMVVEDSADCEDGGKTVVREMNPFEVEPTIMYLVRKWIEESLNKAKECLQKAKENEVSFSLFSVFCTNINGGRTQYIVNSENYITFLFVKIVYALFSCFISGMESKV